MCHAGNANELLKILGNELRPVVREDARPRLRELLSGSLQQDIDIGFAHGLTQTPIDDIAAGAIQHRAKIVKSSMNVDVRDVDVPMLMRRQGLLEPFAFLAGLL